MRLVRGDDMPAMAPPSRRPPMALVAEDEPPLRLAAVDMVRDAGFAVMEAANAPAALRVLERRAAGVHAVFTGVDMPGGMDGLRLATTVCERWPWIALVVTSGHQAAAQVTLPERAVLLPKPCRKGKVVAEPRRLTA